MKLTKKAGSTDSIRKVWDDDKTMVYGLLGQVGDFMKKNIFIYCDYPEDVWLFLGNRGYTDKDIFGGEGEKRY